MDRQDDNTVVASGKGGIIGYAVQQNGKMPAEEFIAGLHKSLTPQKKAKLLALFQSKADGTILSQVKFKLLKDGIYEFKSGQARVLCFTKGSDIYLTNGYIKKKDKCPPREINKAKRIKREHLSAR